MSFTLYSGLSGFEGRHARARAGGLTYVGPKDVIGDGGLVDGRIFVRLEVDKRIVRDAFGGGFLCRYRILHVSKLEGNSRIELPGGRLDGNGNDMDHGK